MKNLKIFSLILVMALSALMPLSASAQCTCDQTRLKNILDNASITLLTTSMTTATSISPNTQYYLRVTASTNACFLSGSGCSAIGSPINLQIKIMDGATKSDGVTYVPPAYGMDVSPPSYQALFSIKTLSGDDFTNEIFFKIGAQCFPSSTCGYLTSNALADQLIIKP